MLEIRGLEKSYKTLKAVGGVSFSIADGETLGLLGPNGAGKTTTVSMICGLVPPDSGEVLIDGVSIQGDTNPQKRRIGLVPQELAVYEELTARQNLQFFGSLYDIRSAALETAMDEALALVGLADRGDDRVKTFSGGMKRRLNLAASLLHDPQILILDEPTVGVDPQSRNAIFENLEALKARGKSLLYTTHYMEEAERLCDRIVILDQGKIVAADTLRGLYKSIPKPNRVVLELDDTSDGPWLDELRDVGGVIEVVLKHDELVIEVTDLGSTRPSILKTLSSRQKTYSRIASERPDLESVFLSLTGRSLRDS